MKDDKDEQKFNIDDFPQDKDKIYQGNESLKEIRDRTQEQKEQERKDDLEQEQRMEEEQPAQKKKQQKKDEDK